MAEMNDDLTTIIAEESKRIATEMAEIQDRKIGELLDQNGLESVRDPKELERRGYKLVHEIERGDVFNAATRHTVTLYKIVGHARWSTKVNLGV